MLLVSSVLLNLRLLIAPRKHILIVHLMSYTVGILSFTSRQTHGCGCATCKEAMAKKKPLMKNRRVIVTGVGVLSPIGHDPDTFYSNLLEGIRGISQIEAFDYSEFPKNCWEIKEFSTDGWVAPKLLKRADKFMLYMLTTGKKALADDGITKDLLQDLDKARCGVLIGSALGGMKALEVSLLVDPYPRGTVIQQGPYALGIWTVMDL